MSTAHQPIVGKPDDLESVVLPLLLLETRRDERRVYVTCEQIERQPEPLRGRLSERLNGADFVFDAERMLYAPRNPGRYDWVCESAGAS